MKHQIFCSRPVRAAWHRLNPLWLRLRARYDKVRAHAGALPAKWLRRNWPAARQMGDKPAVAIVAVNYNTAAHLAHLVFSLYRILGREEFVRLVVVDNASTDGSTEMLRDLQERGICDVIFNKRQRYHGPALNQAIRYLSGLARRGTAIDYIWILDSDTLVLRKDVVHDVVAEHAARRAGIIGELQTAELAEGYAHPSCMLLKPSEVWRRSIDVFEEDGTPAKRLHISLRRHSIPIVDFPFRSKQYVLHLGRATLKSVYAASQAGNRYFSFAAEYNAADYHGNPNGSVIFRAFMEKFEAEVPEVTGPALAKACSSGPMLALELPAVRGDFGRSRGDDAAQRSRSRGRAVTLN